MAERLRILMALQYYLPHRTGLTLHVQRIAEALAARGHRVTVVSARHERSLARDEMVNGVRVIRLWAPLRVSRGVMMPAYPWAALGLVRRHDVVSVHTPMLEVPVLALLARLCRKGLVITHHGDLVLPAGRLNRFIEDFTFRLFRLAGASAHRIIVYSRDYADHSRWVRGFRDRTSVVYPPVIIPAPDPTRAAALRRDWLGHRGTRARVVGYAGRFVEEKRPDILIRALPVVQERYPETCLVFAGQYRLAYERFYERHAALVARHRADLVFLGLLADPNELASFYAACDVLAVPSDTECFALVQPEAMRCGTPVVATDIPGAREPIRVTGMGRIVPRGDPEALGRAVVHVLDDRAGHVKPLAAIDAAFNLEETVRRYERYLLAAAADGRGSTSNTSVPPETNTRAKRDG